MELSPVGTWFYFLMVVTLYTSPVVVGFLIFALVRKQFAKALAGVLISLPVLALIVQLGFHLTDELEKADVRGKQVRLDEVFGPTNRERLIEGGLVGHAENGSYRYARYQFALPEVAPMRLELVVPPTDVTAGTMISLAEPMPAIEPAHLFVFSRGVTRGPQAQRPVDYFSEYYPEFKGDLKSDRVLLLYPLPTGGQLTYFSGMDNKYPWRTQPTYVRWEDFDKLGSDPN